jgi:hypothetical protein
MAHTYLALDLVRADLIPAVLLEKLPSPLIATDGHDLHSFKAAWLEPGFYGCRNSWDF